MSFKKIFNDIKRRYPEKNTQAISLSGIDLSELSQKNFKKLIVSINKRYGNLQDLDLSNTSINELPKEIGILNNLRTLNLSRNNLSQLPAEIGNLNNLTNLNLGTNSFNNQLPIVITNLNNLRVLNLTENNINQLPAEIANLNNLTSLNLSENSINQLPPEIGQLNNLTNLNLYFNNLNQLPPEIGQLNNLTRLDISNNNRITQLPPEIGNLNSLTHLSATNNGSLTSLPPDIQRLNSLTTLNVSNNPNLAQLPSEIGQLNNLRDLDVSGNTQVTQIPAEISNLNNLRYLNISNNPQLNLDNMQEGMFTRIESGAVNIRYDGMSRGVTNQLHRTLGLPLELLEYEKTLEKLYEDESLNKMKAFIENLDNTLSEGNSYKTGRISDEPDEQQHRFHRKMLPAKEVVIQLLERYPKSEGENQKYFDASLKNMLDQFNIEDENLTDIKNKDHLASIATCLGDCVTPIKTKIMENMLVANDPDLDMDPFILRLALQDKITSSFSEELKELWNNESIEVANAFTNCALLENADSHPDNPLKVSGDRAYSPSLSNYTDQGFEKLNNASPELLESVAKLFCKEDGKNGLEIEDGKYNIDIEKLKGIKKEYLEKKLGSNLSRSEIDVKNTLYNFDKEYLKFIQDYDAKFQKDYDDASIFEISGCKDKRIEEEFNRVIDVDTLTGILEEKLKESTSLKDTKEAFMKQCKLEFEKCINDYVKNEKLEKVEKKTSIDQLAAVPSMSQRSRGNSRQSQNSRLSRSASRQLLS
ncbi:hypothetical protein A8C32_18110 [Flavivirga aquatica]|uniref:Disease resistance R13L4/SHOC-2-like LRR domain-containing protein n=1 Tax=Flavivirga aquatica TaxID=1849968 RepID=A0A1E5T7J7_9FLAO|nr:hypothetical protein [Flavivirga aquatica]OEK07351.1 hypothetical protein A8C32_18110 [Flavivirga aquatica]